MNKTLMQKLFLILLPVMAVALATTGDSVTVFDPATGNTITGSYFALIPETGNLQILPPVAGILAVAALVLAIYYMVKTQAKLLRGIVWTALLSASAAALPIGLAEGIVVVPHVVLPLLMCAQAGLAYFVSKQPQEKKVEAGQRLKRK